MLLGSSHVEEDSKRKFDIFWGWANSCNTMTFRERRYALHGITQYCMVCRCYRIAWYCMLWHAIELEAHRPIKLHSGLFASDFSIFIFTLRSSAVPRSNSCNQLPMHFSCCCILGSWENTFEVWYVVCKATFDDPLIDPMTLFNFLYEIFPIYLTFWWKFSFPCFVIQIMAWRAWRACQCELFLFN